MYVIFITFKANQLSTKLSNVIINVKTGCFTCYIILVDMYCMYQCILLVSSYI